MTRGHPEILSQPVKDIGSQPSDVAAVKSPLSRETAEHHHRQKHPSGPAREACDIMCAEELLPGGEPLIDPRRQTDVLGGSDRARPLRGQELFRVHKRPSCVVPVV